MANIKISQMPALATMNDTALMPVVDGVFNKRITGLVAKTYVSSSPILTGTPSSTGIFTINYNGSSDSSLVIAGSNTRGGAGFHDFLVAKNGAYGATNVNKFFRVNSTGSLEIVDSAYSSVILRLTDNGQLALGGYASDVNITTVSASNLILSTNNGTSTSKILINTGVNSSITLLPSGTGSVKIATVDGVLKGTNGAVGSATTADIVAVFGTLPKNNFLASPSGASGLTAFRKLTADDIPGTLNNTVIAGSLVVTGTTTTVNSNDLAVANKRIDLGSVSPVSPTATVTAGSAVVTNLSSLANIISGSAITSLASAGTVTLPAGTVVASIDTPTQITLNQPLTGTGTASSATLNISGATDITANSGGLSLSGTTDKTIIWDSTNTNWTSSEHWNIVTGKTYKINNITVLSDTTVLGSATAVTAGGSGTTAVALGTNTGAATTVTAGGAITGNILKIAGTAGGTVNLTSDVTTGTVNAYTGVTTGTVNLATGGGSTVNIGGAASAVNIGTTGGNSVLTIRGNTSAGTATIATNALTAVVFNTNATTVDAFGSAATLNLGAGTGTTTINSTILALPNATSFTMNGASPAITTTSTATASVFDTNALTGNLFGAATTIAIGAGTGTTTVNNNLTVTGNLTVNGTTTTVNATTVTVDDINIELGSVASPTNTTANGGGITLKGATDKTITWDSTNTNWTSSEHWNIVTGKSFKINNTAVLSATTLGSGVTASSLTSVGTLANLTVTNTISGSVSGSAGSVAAGNITGTTLASGVTASSLTSVGALTSLTTSGDITLNTNNKSLKFTTTTGANVSLIQQNDDNFVLYSTNAVGGQRPIWSIFGQSSSSSFSVAVPTIMNAALTVKDVRDTVYTSGSTTGTITPDCANGNVQTITLTGSITLDAFANPVSGQTMTMIITQPASGGPYTLTSSMKFAGGAKTLSTGANAVDMLTISYIGTTYYASLVTGFA